VTAAQGWRPFSPPKNPVPRVSTAFSRLAHAHLASTSADAALTTALAGSLFFTLPSSEARGKVLLYLAFTMLPFSLVAPLIGPLLDRIRGGRRLMVIFSAVGRAVLCFFMIQHVKSLLFFPEAFGVLVLQKSYTVTKPALVPATVSSDDELVEANSKLSLLSGIGSVAGAAPGGLAYKIWGPEGALGIAMVLYLVAAVLGTRLPKHQVAAERASTVEREELHSASIILGGSAMGMLRGIVGFLTLFLAFAFRKKGVPIWELGVVGGVSVVGSQVGALIAPGLRRMTREENLITAALAASTIAAVLASLMNGLPAAMVLSATIGISAATAKLAFDSIVQRDAPDANWGRSFARFETRFQIMWVVGALLALAVATAPNEVGYVAVLLAAGLALFTYVIGSIAAGARHQDEPLTGVDAAAVEIDERMTQLADDAKQRVRDAARGRLRRRGPVPPPRLDDATAPAPVVPPTFAPPAGPPLWTGEGPPPPGLAASGPDRWTPPPAVPVLADDHDDPDDRPSDPFEPSPMTFAEPEWKTEPPPPT